MTSKGVHEETDILKFDDDVYNARRSAAGLSMPSLADRIAALEQAATAKSKPPPPPPPRVRKTPAAASPAQTSASSSSGAANGAAGKLPLSNLQRRWSKARAAGFVSGSLERIHKRLSQVEDELEEAKAELSKRRSTLEQLDQTLSVALGWTEAVDPDSGLPYYYHAQTGATVWDRPHDLPVGWGEVVDESGALYYYNETSGETQWERPGSEPAAQPQPDGAMGAAAQDGTDDEGEGEDDVPGPEVPLWRAMGLKWATAEKEEENLEAIEAAIQEGDYERAISLRDSMRLSQPRSNSIHRMSAML